MRSHSTILSFIFFFVSTLIAQPELKRLESAWQEERLAEVKQALPDAMNKYPEHPTVLFFQAVTEENGDKAAQIYQRICTIPGGHDWVDDSLYRLAQYQFSRGRYREARQQSSLLMRRYGTSPWVDDSVYLCAQCFWAEGKTDSAQWMLRKLIKDSPRSFFADLAVQDLEADVWKKSQPKPRLQSSADKSGYFTIQVGAFSVRENAAGILKGLEKVGYRGEIVEKQVGSRTFFAVWIGQFPDRNAAEEYAKRFIIKLTKEYQIVQKK